MRANVHYLYKDGIILRFRLLARSHFAGVGVKMFQRVDSSFGH